MKHNHALFWKVASAVALLAPLGTSAAARADALIDDVRVMDQPSSAPPPRAPVADPRGTPTVTATPTARPAAAHPTPRLELAYRRFGISNLDGTSLPLEGLMLDLYPLSTRFFRAGLSFEGGRGHGTLADTSVTLGYGLLGFVAGLQYPARVTPFLEGRITGGVLSGSLDGALSIPGTSFSVSGGSASTWIYGRGIDVGVDVYAIGRVFLVASVGWLRTTWRGVDIDATAAAPTGGIQYRNLTGDSLTFKLGLGF